jgi:hypothetical protein
VSEQSGGQGIHFREWEALKKDLEQYRLENNKKLDEFAKELFENDEQDVASKKLRILRDKSHNQRPKLEEIRIAAARLAYLKSKTGSVKSRNALDGFVILGKFEEDNMDDNKKRRLTGRWVGFNGSSFYPKKFTIFTLCLKSSKCGFDVLYRQRDKESDELTDYNGNAYFILAQLWLFFEEKKGNELTVMQLQRPDSQKPASMSGVFIGRGGGLGDQYPASGKVFLTREEYCGKVEAPLKTGWLSEKEITEVGGENFQLILDHVEGRLDKGDHVFRARNALTEPTMVEVLQQVALKDGSEAVELDQEGQNTRNARI